MLHVRTLGSEALFLGDDLLPWLLLAFGAAMVAGNVFAMIKPPEGAEQDGKPAPRPDPSRTWGMIVVGAIAAIWALATLLK